MRRILIGLVIVAVAACIYTPKQSYADETAYRYIEDSKPRIIVEGIGRLTAKPDEAVVNLGLITEETSLKRAFGRQTEDMNAVIGAIKALGIKDEDIKTTTYNVIPIYKDTKVIWWQRKPSSYRLDHKLTVKIRNLSKVGDVIDRVVESGAIYLYGLEFKSSKIGELEKQVRLNAAKNAREKAQLLAEGTGFKLGSALKVVESAERPRYERGMYLEKTVVADEAAPQVEAGSIELRATCTIIYEIIQ